MGQAMTAELGLASEPRPVASAIAPDRSRDRWFFTGMAVAAAVTAFVGFARTYYLRDVFLGDASGAPALPTLVHVHGVVMTGWILLFLTQASLIASKRTDIHRRLGLAGAVLAMIVLVVGYLTAIEGARRGITPPGGPPPMAFLSVPLGTIAAFAILAAAGISQRRRSETHKRLMLLATIAVLTPALARIGRLVGIDGPPVAIGGTCAFVLTCMLYDRWAHGRVHPAFLWGGILLMLSLPARFAIGTTDAWRSVAEWLTR
jgi:uncharacterized membrane protein YozB (DUF420 family)